MLLLRVDRHLLQRRPVPERAAPADRRVPAGEPGPVHRPDHRPTAPQAGAQVLDGTEALRCYQSRPGGYRGTILLPAPVPHREPAEELRRILEVYIVLRGRRESDKRTNDCSTGNEHFSQIQRNKNKETHFKLALQRRTGLLGLKS